MGFLFFAETRAMTWNGRLRPMCLLVPVVALAACDEGEGSASLVLADSFCAEALEGVDRFMAQARTSQASGSSETDRATVVVAGVAKLSSGMNAFAASDYSSVQVQQFVHLMPLIAYDEALQPVPNLAESWEVGEDGTTITFHLRSDVFWHDGEPTDAHDVAFTYIRMTDPRTAFQNAGYWTFYESGSEGVEVLDDFTVRMHMQPHEDFMDPWRTVGIMPEHLLGDVAPEELGAHPFGSRCPVGNRPFVFVEHRAGDRWVFEANPVFPSGLGGQPQAALDMSTQLGEERWLGEIHKNYGVLFREAKRHALAEESLNRALSLAQKGEGLLLEAEVNSRGERCELELLMGHSDDRVLLPIESDRLADDISTTAVLVVPKPVREHRHRLCPPSIFALDEAAPQRGR